MKKFRINDLFIRERELREELRFIRASEELPEEGDEMKTYREGVLDGIDLVIHRVYLEELREAGEDEDARQAIIEMPGDFAVSMRDGDNHFWFVEWDSGNAVTSEDSEKAMVFSYEGMAEETAKKLKEITGDEWAAHNINVYHYRIVRSLLDAIFDEGKYVGQDAE